MVPGKGLVFMCSNEFNYFDVERLRSLLTILQVGVQGSSPELLSVNKKSVSSNLFDSRKMSFRGLLSMMCSFLSGGYRCYLFTLGVVHNCHHLHERTQRTLGEGVMGERTLFYMSFTVMEIRK